MVIEVRKPTEEEKKTAEHWPIWEKDVSTFSWEYDASEMCFMLEGRAKVKGESGEEVEFGAGDWVRFPKGLSCVWIVEEPVKKRYMFKNV